MVDVKKTLQHVESDQDEYVTGVNMVTRVEVEPMADHFALVTLHYWESPDAAKQNQPPKLMKFAICDDLGQALSKTLL